MLKKVTNLMIHCSKEKIVKHPIMQNSVAIMNIDEIQTKPRRIFLGQHNLLRSAANSPQEAPIIINTNMIKGVTDGNDHAMLCLDPAKTWIQIDLKKP